MGSSRLYEFSKILSVPVSYFFEDMDKTGVAAPGAVGVAEEAPAFEHEKMSSRETLEMMRAYYRINDTQVRKRVFDLIKSLADDKAGQNKCIVSYSRAAAGRTSQITGRSLATA